MPHKRRPFKNSCSQGCKHFCLFYYDITHSHLSMFIRLMLKQLFSSRYLCFRLPHRRVQHIHLLMHGKFTYLYYMPHTPAKTSNIIIAFIIHSYRHFFSLKKQSLSSLSLFYESIIVCI